MSLRTFLDYFSYLFWFVLFLDYNKQFSLMGLHSELLLMVIRGHMWCQGSNLNSIIGSLWTRQIPSPKFLQTFSISVEVAKFLPPLHSHYSLCPVGTQGRTLSTGSYMLVLILTVSDKIGDDDSPDFYVRFLGRTNLNRGRFCNSWLALLSDLGPGSTSAPW